MMGIALVCVGVILFAVGCGKKEEQVVRPEATGAEIAQKICPVMDAPIDESIYADYEGRRVYFCCQMCVAEFKAEPEKYLKKLDEQLSQSAKPGNEGVEDAHEGHAH